MNTVISKRPTTIEFVEWDMDDVQHKMTPIRSVTIFGGAGVTDPRALIVPEGVATYISDEALAWLETLPKFKRHVDRGIFRVVKGKKIDSEAANEIAASGKMIDNKDIPARPLNEEQLKKDGAVINEDGSIDISKGGAKAPEKEQRHIQDNQRREKASARNKGKK